MNYMLLVNVLEYVDRENLEKLSIVSRLFEKVVRLEFPQHPFRVLQELHIVTGTNGAIGFGMSQYGISLKITSITPPEANVVEFRGRIQSDIQSWFSDSMQYFSVSAVLPFMAKSVRFQKTIIELNVTLLSPQSITLLENCAYLWTGRILELRHGYDDVTDNEHDTYNFVAPNKAIIPNCDRIFNAPGIITPCRELEIYRINVPLTNPTLYSLKTIKILEVHGFSADNLLSFVEDLSKYNSTTQLVCFSRVNFQRTHLEMIRESFSKAKVAHAWKLFLVDRQLANGLSGRDRFRDENLLTMEVLEFCSTDSQVKEDLCTSLGIFFCPSFGLWILERKSF